jgi:hypothetical protein
MRHPEQFEHEIGELLDEAGLDVALKVGVASPEVNPRLLTEADLVVDGPGGLLYLLRTL